VIFRPTPHRLVGSALLLLAVNAPALAQRVGVASGVIPATTGTVPGAQSRSIVVGTDIIHRETIVTEAAGQAQLVFLDRSAFTVGPGSEVVIDEFVYDPNAGTGKIVATATKGVFRYVGGALSKNEGAVTIKTPEATIGIRGGIALFSIDAATHAVDATLLHGVGITLTAANGDQLVITRPGFTASFDPRSGHFSPPVPAMRVGDQMGRLDGRSGGGPPPPGGPPAPGNLARLNSGNLAGSIGAAQGALPHAPPPPPPGNPNSGPPIRLDRTGAGNPKGTGVLASQLR
jgi:hypothetical protein